MLAESLDHAKQRLLASWTPRGAFDGELSSSALSTAVAAMAFAMSAQSRAADDPQAREHDRLAANGRAWLVRNQNVDGGWGDTTCSPTNISTTTLCWVSLGFGDEAATRAALARAETKLTSYCGGVLSAQRLAATIRARYGKDQTFSVPILTTCALGGRLEWKRVPALPFELAACPQSWFHLLGLPMVSYALPALIAIGQVRHHHRKTRNPLTRIARWLARRRTLRVLERIQPASGGYLEAAPLTSFVTMSLLSMRMTEHPVVQNGLRFLRETVREDGAWPIDTNLDTWVTTLSVHALARVPDHVRDATRRWLLEQQYREVHPYTGAAPGGWAWTDLTGGVPDADDTAGALLALRKLDPSAVDAATHGVGWLCDLQNRDGGVPTFCRGWGRLPFDRSSPDITAHALRACAAWRSALSRELASRVDRVTVDAIDYLLRTRRPDGAWIPLWFGNQSEPAEENPLYGTSRVLRAIATVECSSGQRSEAWREAGRDAVAWLCGIQHRNGGFGAGPGVPPSIEETALAVESLAEWGLARSEHATAGVSHAIAAGADWLAEKTDRGTRFPVAPIGLYFAKLWYHERLYPLVFTVSALDGASRYLSSSSRP